MFNPILKSPKDLRDFEYLGLNHEDQIHLISSGGHPYSPDRTLKT